MRVQRGKASSLKEEEPRKASCRQANLSLDFSHSEVKGTFKWKEGEYRHRGTKTRHVRKNKESNLAGIYVDEGTTKPGHVDLDVRPQS